MSTIRLKGADSLKAKLKELSRKVEKPAKLRVGFLETATYPDKNNTPVAMIAAIQNFGAPRRGIPPRPFFSNMVKDKSPAWPEAVEQNLKATGYDATKTMDLMGIGIGDQLRDAINDTNEPPLSPITVMLRGMRSQGVTITGKTVGIAAKRVRDGKTNYGASTKVLIDTGNMYASVDHEVES